MVTVSSRAQEILARSVSRKGHFKEGSWITVRLASAGKTGSPPPEDITGLTCRRHRFLVTWSSLSPSPCLTLFVSQVKSCRQRPAGTGAPAPI